MWNFIQMKSMKVIDVSHNQNLSCDFEYLHNADRSRMEIDSFHGELNKREDHLIVFRELFQCLRIRDFKELCMIRGLLGEIVISSESRHPQNHGVGCDTMNISE
jgi:hypothetical protein